MLCVCAWVFSNSGCHDEAASTYCALLALHPDWIEFYRHASSALLAAGRVDEATAYATTAAGLAPSDLEIAVQAAELLMRRGDAAAAAELLRNTAAHGTDARLWRVLSAAEMLRGAAEAALAAIDRAIMLAPDNVEYHVHRSHLLAQSGDLSTAAAALERAAALDPVNRDVKRAQLSLFASSGLVTEATAVGGDLLHCFPDDKNAVEAVWHLLGQRVETIDGDYVVLRQDAERVPRSPRQPPSWRERLRSQRRVIRALIIRETRTRFGDAKLGYGWALLEPILHISLLSVTFAVLMHGRPPIGTHFFIFYYTGLIRYSGADGTKKFAGMNQIN
ncbi:MAG TPA: tetratricopeptide repeat protein [Stellaceae bacterium]|nr:tetratricopeptide repeat protein [Stellaceae bacterium]